jgi:hypothetical protein
MKEIKRGTGIELPGVAPALVALLQRMICVRVADRPTAIGVIEVICRNSFALGEGVRVEGVRRGLWRLGVEQNPGFPVGERDGWRTQN